METNIYKVTMFCFFILNEIVDFLSGITISTLYQMFHLGVRKTISILDENYH